MVRAPADDEGPGYRGYGRKIIRDGKERVVACPGDKNDTIETLAEKLYDRREKVLPKTSSIIFFGNNAL